MTQSSLLGFGNKGAAGWGCAQHYKSQQQLRLGMLGCLRRPSCHGRPEAFLYPLLSHLTHCSVTPPSCYMLQTKTPEKPRNYWCLRVPGGFHPLLPPVVQGTKHLYPESPWLGTAETPPDRKAEVLVIKPIRARTGLKRAKQMPGEGRACCFTEAFLQAGSVLAHAAQG